MTSGDTLFADSLVKFRERKLHIHRRKPHDGIRAFHDFAIPACFAAMLDENTLRILLDEDVSREPRDVQIRQPLFPLVDPASAVRKNLENDRGPFAPRCSHTGAVAHDHGVRVVKISALRDIDFHLHVGAERLARLSAQTIIKNPGKICADLIVWCARAGHRIHHAAKVLVFQIVARLGFEKFLHAH